MKRPSELSALPATDAPGRGAFFATSLEHLLAELERVDLLIRYQVARARRLHAADREFQGLYIAEEEVDALLAAPAGLPRWAAKAGWPPEVRAGLERLAAGIAERRDESVRQGVRLRLVELARRFGLSDFEVEALLVCLAPEIDLRYERLYAYLQDDVTRKRPSVDLVLSLLCPTFEDKLARRSSFGEPAPLVLHCLLELFEAPSRPHPPLLARYLRLDPRIGSHLFGGDEIDERLRPHARLVEPAARLAELVLPAEVKGRLESLAAAGPGRRRLIYLQGGYGTGRAAAAEALCRAWNLKLLELDLEALSTADAGDLATLVEIAGREARLRGAALLWRGFERLLAGEQTARRARFLGLPAACGGPGFVAGVGEWEPAGALDGVDFLRYELPLPGHGERLELWSRSLNGDRGVADPGDLAVLADKFRLSGGQIRDAAATAASLARRRAAAGGRVSLDDLYAACRLQSNRKLGELARRITPRYRWGDIVLPEGRLAQLREMCDQVRYRARVWGDWGFGRKLSLGRGLCALFAGPSGTGKTMAAEIIAGELGLDLYKIDLSAVVSKYIGETEKNLARIFDEAETSNAILFFDEADALFGKRSAVKDAHDRYANVEISYLLQRMEEYQGISILATNLRQNMDHAFVRRLTFMVRFPFPEADDRRRIWEGIWPPETPRSDDLDLGFIARQFKLTGGNIRNIALSAAYLAAADGQVVERAHLISATRRELRKMGNMVVESQFAEYAGGAGEQGS